MIINNDTELFTEDVDISSVGTVWKTPYSIFPMVTLGIFLIAVVFFSSWSISASVLKNVNHTRRRNLPKGISLLFALIISFITALVLFPPGDSYGETSAMQRVFIKPATNPYQIHDEKDGIFRKEKNQTKETIHSLVKDRVKESFDEKKKESHTLDFDAACKKAQQVYPDKTSVFCGGEDFDVPLKAGDLFFLPRVYTAQEDKDKFIDIPSKDIHNSPHKTTVRATIGVTNSLESTKQNEYK